MQLRYTLQLKHALTFSFALTLRTALTLCLAFFFFNSTLAQKIPLDIAVHTGTLANGFTYYIRHNNEPKNRVYLYLVNKVGSVLEDEDQQGLAHFMEHMNFNGTTHCEKSDPPDTLGLKKTSETLAGPAKIY
jgi:zinc protease